MRADARRLLPLLLAWPGLAAAAGWPDVPLPGDSTSEWVSKHMVYNGIDMRARRFRSAATPAETIAFYEKAWAGRMVRDEVDGKTVIGHLAGTHYVTVEVAAAGAATQGTIGIMRMPAGPPAQPPGHGFARPSGSEVVNDIRYLDTPRETRTVVLRNAISPYANGQFYRQRLAAQGWTASADGRCVAASSACVADFEKAGGARMRMSIRREGDRTVVVANLE